MADDAHGRNRKAFCGSIHVTLNHLLLVDYLWTNRMQKQPDACKTLREVLRDDPAALRATQEKQAEWFIDYVDGLSPDDLASPFL